MVVDEPLIILSATMQFVNFQCYNFI